MTEKKESDLRKTTGMRKGTGVEKTSQRLRCTLLKVVGSREGKGRGVKERDDEKEREKKGGLG